MDEVMIEQIVELLRDAYSDGYQDGMHGWGGNFDSFEWISKLNELNSEQEGECPHGLAAWLCEGPNHYPTDM